MINKDQVLTIVSSQNVSLEEIDNKLKNTFSLDITQKVVLGKNSYDFFINSISDAQIQEIKKYFFDQKTDCCIQSINNREKKIFLSDMDATIIENETLDDLVKISGVTDNIDETSKLAMEGKIDIQTTLNLRVNYLKNKPRSLIDEVLKGIKFNQGSKILVQTLNSKNFITTLITGGFAPISTYVGDTLGFQNIISNEFKFEGDKFTGEYISITGEKNSKLNYLNEFTETNKIEKSKVLAIGDGANDLGMLKNAGLGVGYNAHEIVRQEVKEQIFFNDLTTILFYLGISKAEFKLD